MGGRRRRVESGREPDLPAPRLAVPAPSSALSVHGAAGILELQRAIGNRAVTRLVRGGVVQPKLQVGPAGDRFEREADQVADEVMRNLAATPMSDEGEVRVSRSVDETAVGLEGGPLGAETEASIERARGQGFGLPASLRQTMEDAFGADFTGVRVHAEPAADDLNRSMQSQAFTVGSDIFFARDKYQPRQLTGQRLLAHELTHTIQQGAARMTRKTPSLDAPLPPSPGTASPDTRPDEPGRLGSERGGGTASGSRTRRRPERLGAVHQQETIQRDIGFEYEVNRNTYVAPAPLNKAARQNLAAPVGSQALGKGAVLVGNMGVLHAKADLGGTLLGSNLEFETTHVPETAAGRLLLVRALKTVERFCMLLDNAAAHNYFHVSAGKFAAALGGATGGPHRYIHMAAAGPTIGNPQATVGVKLGRMEELMETTVGAPAAGLNALLPGAPLSRTELGATPANAADFFRVGNAPQQVRTGIFNYVAGGGGAAVAPVGFPSDELIGLCALMVPYFVRGSGPALAFAKQIAPLMARTNFGSIFTTDVPGPEQAFLSAWDRFRAMWVHILAAAGVAGGTAAPLFAFDPGALVGAELPAALSRQTWIRGIALGVDRLTTANIPVVPAGGPLTANQALVLSHPAGGNDPLAIAGAAMTPGWAAWLSQYRGVGLFGLGSLGAGGGPDHDVVDPAGAPQAAPVVELRRMLQDVDVHTFTEQALGVFDYIVGLNAAGVGVPAPGYNRVARPVTGPKLHHRAFFKAAN